MQNVTLCFGLPLSSIPSYTSCRNWILRIGYWQLQQTRDFFKEDFVFIFDFTSKSGEDKALVILAAPVSSVMKGQPLRHEDVQVIDIHPVKTASGQVVYERLLVAEETAGRPVGLISDGAGDVQSGQQLYVEKRETEAEENSCLLKEEENRENKTLTRVYDITHKMGRIFAAELEKDERWIEFTQKAHQCAAEVRFNRLAPLGPPSQKTHHGRWLNLAGLVSWARKIEEKVFVAEGWRKLDPGYGLTRRTLEELKPKFRKSLWQRQRLEKLVGKKYETIEEYEEAIEEQGQGYVSKAMLEALKEKGDLRRQEVEEHFGWIKAFTEDVEDWAAMVNLSGEVQEKIKKEGLSLKTLDGLKQKMEETAQSERVRKFSDRVWEHLEEVKRNWKGGIMPGSSDIIESMFGKFNWAINEGKKGKGICDSILLLAAQTMKATKEKVREALSRVSMEDVSNWTKENIGATFLQVRRRIMG